MKKPIRSRLLAGGAVATFVLVAACGNQQTGNDHAETAKSDAQPQAVAAPATEPAAEAKETASASPASKRSAVANSGAKSNDFWWPESLDLSQLRQNEADSDPDEDFDYAEAFESLDLNAVKQDIEAVCPSSNNLRPLIVFSNGVSGSSYVSI